jgi:xylulokinase
VVGGGADNACGAVGVGAVQPGTVVASWGSSGTVLAPTAAPKVDPLMRAHTFCSAVPGQWYVMGVMLSAGAAFGWYRDNLAPGTDSLALNKEAASVAPGAEGITFLPYLQGERTPHRDARARGAMVGMSLSHGRAQVTRAVMEGVCFGLRDSVEILRGLKLPLKNILLTGGGAKSPMLRKMQADVYGIPVRTVDKEEGPAFGAALLSAVGVGAFKDVSDACRSTLKASSLLRPDARQHKLYDIPYRRFRALYPALRPFFNDQAL